MQRGVGVASGARSAGSHEPKPSAVGFSEKFSVFTHGTNPYLAVGLRVCNYLTQSVYSV